MNVQKNFFPSTSLEGQSTWSKLVKIHQNHDKTINFTRHRVFSQYSSPNICQWQGHHHFSQNVFKILDQKTKPNCTPVFRRWFYPLCDYKPNQIFWTFEPGAICEVKYRKMNRKKRRIESGDSLFRGSEYFVSLNLRKLMMSLSVETCSICFAFYHRPWRELMVFFQMFELFSLIKSSGLYTAFRIKNHDHM